MIKGIAALQEPGIVASDFRQTAWAVVGRAIGNCGGNLPTLYSDDQIVYGCTKLVAAPLRGGEQASAKKVVAQRGRFVGIPGYHRSEAAYLLRSDRARDWQPWPPPGLAIGQITVRKKSLVNQNKPRAQRKSEMEITF